MRCLLLVLLGLTTCCMAQLPVIPRGTVPKEVEIYDGSRRQAFLSSSSAFLVGVVVSSSSEVQQSAAEMLLEETCILRIEAMQGTLSALAGATTVRLTSTREHDKYQQLEPDWGVYRHLKTGQRVVALLNEEEGRPEIRTHGLIVLNEKTQSMPEILRRTGADASRFTPADLAVLKEASPLFYGEVVAVAEATGGVRSDEAADLNSLVGVCVALFFGGVLCADYARRRGD